MKKNLVLRSNISWAATGEKMRFSYTGYESEVITVGSESTSFFQS